MFDIDYLPQLEKFRKHLFGSNPESPRENYSNYSLPPNVKIIECERDENGEWVPKKDLEEKTNSE